ncbi:MAG: serine/threonine-protein phosphatase, partial [Magnetococcales bacterium]|nr:serine/threonine-protein phosphatase [Magnetococcales bacterium]
LSDLFYESTLRGDAMQGIVEAVNAKLHAILPESMFMVGCFVEVSPQRDRLRVWNCGLPEAFLYLDGATRPQHIASSCYPRGLMVEPGDVSPDWIIVQESAHLYCHTDGIVEERDQHGAIFGIKRLETLMGEVKQGGLPLERVAEVLADFRGNKSASDDLTLVELTL